MANTDRDEILTKEESEQQKDVIRMNEKEILNALIKAGSFKTDKEDVVPISIVRRGETLLTFGIRPLGEEEYYKCRKANTNYKRNRSVGTRVAESVNTGRYRAQVIYEATVEEDRRKLWDNRDAWDAFSVTNGIDLIEVVLMAGEKDKIIDKIDEISGYMLTEEETAKN